MEEERDRLKILYISTGFSALFNVLFSVEVGNYFKLKNGFLVVFKNYCIYFSWILAK